MAGKVCFTGVIFSEVDRNVTDVSNICSCCVASGKLCQGSLGIISEQITFLVIAWQAFSFFFSRNVLDDSTTAVVVLDWVFQVWMYILSQDSMEHSRMFPRRHSTVPRMAVKPFMGNRRIISKTPSWPRCSRDFFIFLGLHSFSAFLTICHSKRLTILPNIHLFMLTFTHRRRCQPREATASSSGAVRVRFLAQGHPDTRTSNLPVTCQPALPPEPHVARIQAIRWIFLISTNSDSVIIPYRILKQISSSFRLSETTLNMLHKYKRFTSRPVIGSLPLLHQQRWFLA